MLSSPGYNTTKQAISESESVSVKIYQLKLPNLTYRYPIYFSIQKLIVTKIRCDPKDLKIVTSKCDVIKYNGDLGSWVHMK